MNPQISVVIPTYNRAKLISRALESVLRQLHRPDEIIVVDDGSNDNTRQVVDSFGSEVHYMYQSNAGASSARNKGVAEAHSEWIAFLDSDDQWSPGYLDSMVRAIEATGGAGWFYFSDARFLSANSTSTYWEEIHFSVSSPFQLITDARQLVLRDLQPMLLPFSVLNKQRYSESGGLWEQLKSAEDTHLFTKLGLDGSACAVACVGGVVTADSDSKGRLTHLYRAETDEHWRNLILLCEDILRRFPTLGASESRLMKSRISDSHWRIARRAWSEGRLLRGVEQGVRAVGMYPLMIPRLAARTARRLLRHSGGCETTV
jgi:glycosyltransferase involved in cell wall biosynthesis